MKTRFLLFALIAPGCMLAGEPEGTKLSVAQQSSALIKQAFQFQSVVTQISEEKKEVSTEVVEMKPFVVVDSPLNRELARHFRKQAQKERDEQFSVTKGGTIYKNEVMNIGASSNQDMFKDDAKYRDKTPMVKIDLLHFGF